MEKQYQILLDNKRAKRMCTHLRNMGTKFIASEVGGVICIQLYYKDNELGDIRHLLDEVNQYFNIYQDNENTMGDF